VTDPTHRSRSRAGGRGPSRPAQATGSLRGGAGGAHTKEPSKGGTALGGRQTAAWGLALGILAYWGMRILGIDRPLKVEPDTNRDRTLF
jgi:hypothetical protein